MMTRTSVLGFLLATSIQGATNIQPHLTLSVNQENNVTIFRGWPILIKLEILRSDSSAGTTNPEPFLIMPGPGGWTNSIRLKIKRNNDGSILSWPCELVGDPREPENISRNEGAEFGWWMHPAESVGLSLGDYQIAAELDTIDSIDGWKGKTNSSTALVHIADEPAPLSAELNAEKLLLLAYYSFWNGNTNEAAGFVRDLVTQQPTNIAALSMSADLAEHAGNHQEALESRSRALQQFFLQNPDTEELPTALIRDHRASLAKVISPASVVLIVRRDGAELVLEWNAAPGVQYRLESSTDLRSWGTLRDGLSTAGSSIETRVPLTERMQFLRVGR
jgi:hypothetical protein